MGKKKSLERHYSKWGYIFIIPFVIFFLIFRFWPLLSTIYYAFCDLKHAGNTDAKFLPAIGLPWYKNFADILTRETFWDAFRNTFKFFIASTVPEWILAFWLAVMITDRRINIKGRTIFKTAFFFPKLVAGTALGGSVLLNVMSFVGNSVGNVATAAMLDGFGVEMKDLEFFMSPGFFIIVVTIFMHFGITFIYAVAGITGIPIEIFEAAEIDGANRIQTFFRVTVPCMSPMMFFISVITIVDGLEMIDIPSYFGPFDTLRRNLTLMMYLEKVFYTAYAYDRASAISVVILLLSGILSGAVYFIFIRDNDEAKLRKLIREERRAAKREM